MSSSDRTNLPTACFSVLAACDPSVMPRVLEQFAKRGLTPSRWVSDVGGLRNEQLSIDLQVEGMDRELAAYVARCLGQLAHVRSVLVVEKGGMGLVEAA